MEQTVDFINQAFVTTGVFEYDSGSELSDTTVKYVDWCGLKEHKTAVQSQSVSVDGATLTFVSHAIDNLTDTECVRRDKNGKVKEVKGGEYLPVWKDYKKESVTTKTPMDSRVTLSLATLDPRTVSVHPNSISTCESLLGHCGVSATYPATYYLTVQAPSATQKGVMQTWSLGMFFDKDLADRVAKAYIHAIVLRHKAEPASIF